MKKSLLIKNTLIVLMTGFVVKIIGMMGKIVTTRILGVEGMSLYVLSYPTLLLFINIASFSLNNSMSKLISEAIVSKKYSPKVLLQKGIKLSLIISLICIIIYLCSIYTISTKLLLNESLFYPLLSGVILIPLVGISDALRGYFNGIKQIKHASTSQFLEQLFRTLFSILGICIGIKFNLILANIFLFIALSLGEIVSIIYCLIIMRKNNVLHFENTKNETKAVFKMSSTLTLSRLVGSITFFIEPIIYTFILTKLCYNPSTIHIIYTEIDAFTIPLLTFISFIPFSLSTAIIPHISESYAVKDYKLLNKYIHKAFIFTFFPAIICLIFVFFFHNELMILIFNTTSGAIIARNFSLFFISYYFQAITVSILQAIGKVKIIFINSFIQNILRILLIIILSFVNNIGPYSIIYASTICINISAITLFLFIRKYTLFKINKQTLFYMIIIPLLIFATISLLTIFNVNYLVTIIFILLIMLLFVIKYRKTIF